MTDSTCPPELAELGKQIKQEEEDALQLQCFGDAINQCGFFTASEIELVAQQCVLAFSEVKRKKNQLAESLRIWERDIVHLQNTINGRNDVIESFDETLRKFPAVLDTMVESQLSIQRELDAAKGQLASNSGASTKDLKDTTSNADTSAPGSVTHSHGASMELLESSVSENKSGDGDSFAGGNVQ